MNAHIVELRREEDRYGQTAEEDRPEKIDVSKEVSSNFRLKKEPCRTRLKVVHGCHASLL